MEGRKPGRGPTLSRVLARKQGGPRVGRGRGEAGLT